MGRKDKTLRSKHKTTKWWNRRIFKWGALAGTGLAGSALAWARYWEPYWLDVSRPTVRVDSVPGLSPLWKGYKIAFLSDLHLERHEPPIRTLWSAVERIVEEKPNLVTLGGDYFTHGKWNPAMADLIRPLVEAGLPVVGIMGNHDYFGRRNDHNRIEEGFAKAGVRMLINEVYPLEYKGQQAWLAGIDDAVKGEPDLAALQTALPPGQLPLVLLSHNPDMIEKLPPHFAGVTLSGHTHGGQINPALPPFNKSLNWIRFAGEIHHSNYPVGWYEYNGNRLYVGRGLGMSGYQLRFNARPELVMLEFI